MKSLTDIVFEAFGKHVFSGGAGGAKASKKGDAGTQVLCHELPE